MLNAVDKAPLAFRLSVARVLPLMLPLAWAASWEAGPSLVYGAELAANVVGGALAFALARRALGDDDAISRSRAAPDRSGA